MAKIGIDFINSAGIRAEMVKDSCATAELLGTFTHPEHSDSNDWTIRLYRAADALVFDTNGDPVWEGDREGFAALVKDYGIDLGAATAEDA
jgi:hypothetical protein